MAGVLAPFKSAWIVLRDAVMGFLADDAFTFGAALAYFATLSLAPMLVILLWVGSMLSPGASQAVVQRVEEIVGPNASAAIDMMISAAREPQVANVAGLISLIFLLVSITGAFAQLQHALNRIWNVAPESKGLGVLGWLRTRAVSLALLLGIAVVLFASLFINAVIRYATNQIFVSGVMSWLLPVVDTLVGLIIFTLLFGMIYKYLPDVEIAWRQVLFGAVVTAILFELGRYAIGLYLGTSGVGSAYGAAGSLVVLLVWVYYASLIVFFGAELTQAYAHHRGRQIAPASYAHHITPPGAPQPPPEPPPPGARPAPG